MAKNYTKYTIEGVAENLGKSKLALAIIEDYLSKNPVDFAILNAAFPDECQGGIHGVFRKKEDVKDFKRYYMDKPIKLIDGNTIVVTNQWGIDNIPGLIERANKLGYKITGNEQILEDSSREKNNFSELSIYGFVKLLEKNAQDATALKNLYSELEKAIESNNNLIPFGLIAMKQSEGQINYVEKFEFASRFKYQELYCQSLSNLEDKPLINLVLDTHEISPADVLEDTNTQYYFLNLLSSYFYYNLMHTIFNENDAELMAEFIVAQSKLSKHEIEAWSEEEDFIADHILDFIEYAIGFNIRDAAYENGCTVCGNQFSSMDLDSGYDYIQLSKDIIKAKSQDYSVKSVNIISSISNPEHSLAGKSEINIAVEIVSTEEYKINYAYVKLTLQVNSKLVEEFNSKCEYDTLYALIIEITSNHAEEILIEAHNQSGLDELLENDFDWFNCDPNIRITEINDVNLSALYENEIQNYQVAELLGVGEDDAESRLSDFLTDLRFAIDRELLFKLLKN
jgi:hypothetical protein